VNQLVLRGDIKFYFHMRDWRLTAEQSSLFAYSQSNRNIPDVQYNIVLSKFEMFRCNLKDLLMEKQFARIPKRHIVLPFSLVCHSKSLLEFGLGPQFVPFFKVQVDLIFEGINIKLNFSDLQLFLCVTNF